MNLNNRRYHGFPIKGGQWNKVPVLEVMKADTIENLGQGKFRIFKRGENYREGLTIVSIYSGRCDKHRFPKESFKLGSH